MNDEEMKTVMARKPNFDKGDRVVSFRGDFATVTGLRLPSHAGASWKVQVQWDKDGYVNEYYSGVFEKVGLVK